MTATTAVAIAKSKMDRYAIERSLTNSAISGISNALVFNTLES
ncbi:MAG: hypothetical protein ACFB2W_05600 [Leptolyngbyaceae cyanobacterium]